MFFPSTMCQQTLTRFILPITINTLENLAADAFMLLHQRFIHKRFVTFGAFGILRRMHFHVMLSYVFLHAKEMFAIVVFHVVFTIEHRTKILNVRVHLYVLRSNVMMLHQMHFEIAQSIE